MGVINKQTILKGIEFLYFRLLILQRGKTSVGFKKSYLYEKEFVINTNDMLIILNRYHDINNQIVFK